jgi:acyl-CoA thioesterase
MSAHAFLGLAATGEAGRYQLPIHPGLCVGPAGNAFMFGGVGLGAAVAAAEHATGRPLVWASAQFLSYARAGDTLDLAVEVLNGGRNVSQLRVMATDAGKPIVSVNAALGAREGFIDDQWAAPPADMPRPEDCADMAIWPPQDGGAAFMHRLEVRVAPGRYGATPRDGRRSPDGRQLMWMRTVEDAPVDAAMLAVMADFVPSGLAAAFGTPGGGNSLDNTLRIVRLVPTRWVLCDIRIAGSGQGFGHGAIYMFAEDGTLLASGSQSVILRFVPERKGA